jgi:hypothetical protein
MARGENETARPDAATMQNRLLAYMEVPKERKDFLCVASGKMICAATERPGKPGGLCGRTAPKIDHGGGGKGVCYGIDY